MYSEKCENKRNSVLMFSENTAAEMYINNANTLPRFSGR